MTKNNYAANKSRSKQSLRLWLKLLSSTHLISKHVREKLRSEFETTLPRFDVLAELARRPNGVTMGDLSSMLLVSKGNLTGLSKRLQKDELILCEPLPTDRRTQLLYITRKGKAAFEAIAIEHEKWVAEILRVLDESEIKILLKLLGKIGQNFAKEL